ncbi:MAG: hypothetical protein AB1758_26375 [Candidatus Eremiobacterota bacterium]
MDIRRGDGWPQRLGAALVTFGLVMGLTAVVLDTRFSPTWSYNARVGLGSGSLLLALMGLLLQCWRRVTTLDRRAHRLSRWWGLALGPWLVPVNAQETRSLEGFDRLVLAPTGPDEHYKSQRNRYQIYLEKAEEGTPLAPRLRVDDELVSPAAARELGKRVAEFLGLELLDRT